MTQNPRFYTVMNYPVPLSRDEFLYIDEIEKSENESKAKECIKKTDKIRETENEYTKKYLEEIHKRWRIYKSIPFIRQIHLCNSISFNALHEKSDIDLFIICNSWFVWLARFWSVLFFFLAKIKRGKKDKKMKFCLSFYADQNHCNFYHLRNTAWDRYLSYWLAHCVLLYTDESLNDNYFWEKNKELLDFLPNHPKKQNIHLDKIIYRWNNTFKNAIIWLSENRIGKIAQMCISKIRKVILYYKKSQLKKRTNKDIIISNNILKFHDDQRALFEFRQKSHSKNKKS